MKDKTKVNANSKVKTRNSFLILSAVVLLISLSLSPLWPYERMELLDPEEQSIIIRFSNVAEFLKAVEQSGPGRLWNSEAMKPFLNNQSLGEALKETLMNSFLSEKAKQKELSHLMWEGLKLQKGELIIGISFGKGDKIDIAVIAEIDKAGFLKTMELSERMSELDEDLGAPQRQSFQGVDIYHSVMKRPEGPDSTWDAFYNGTMVGGDNREWVEHSIVQLKKQPPTSPSGAPLLHLRVTQRFIKGLFEKKPKASQPEGPVDQHPPDAGTEPPGSQTPPTPPPPDAPSPPPPSPAVIMKAMGLDRVQYISFDLTLKPKAMESLFRIKLNPPTGGNRGVWALLGKEPLPSNHRLAYVPEDVYTYQVMRLDFDALWREIPEILKAINPQQAMQFQAFVNMFGAMYQLDLSRDIFGNLGTLFTTYSRMEAMGKQELMALQLRTPAAMEKLLAKLFGEGSMLKSQLKDALEVHELRGHKLYSFKNPKLIPAPPPEAGQQPPQPPNIESVYTGLSVVDGALVFGEDKLVRGMIQATSSTSKISSNGFYTSPLYTEMIRNMPENAVGCSIVDISQLLKPFMGILKNPALSRTLSSRDQLTPPKKRSSSPLTEFFNNLRYDRLPDFEYISSFFGKGIGYNRFQGMDLISQAVFKYPEKR
ncbi:MAG: hypothetical protein GTO45_22095 [Candidatus Aminicenantes bacterium]|nr:hypothetical protein [Candidatus Aminicenantes bacterium]NIM81453.1 hypothetical protein [Candidatus Aminicenantes bacterium]NIN23178.1 hypothetical protein [Candidatus Aminicenantes bacterium]NIN44639.1 hypothetical protein [Candidatus Aminicenantes bacterium]NIN87455.1 hypothetical protein [Candidatus Aminicenantes bacterium]